MKFNLMMALRLKGARGLNLRVLTDRDVSSKPPWMGSRRPLSSSPEHPLTGIRNS